LEEVIDRDQLPEMINRQFKGTSKNLFRSGFDKLSTNGSA